MLPPLDKLTPCSYILPPLAAQLLQYYTPLNELPPQSNSFLTPMAAQLLAHVILSGQINPSLLQHFTPLGSPTLISI